jgi:hypothetical protein
VSRQAVYRTRYTNLSFHDTSWNNLYWSLGGAQRRNVNGWDPEIKKNLQNNSGNIISIVGLPVDLRTVHGINSSWANATFWNACFFSCYQLVFIRLFSHRFVIAASSIHCLQYSTSFTFNIRPSSSFITDTGYKNFHGNPTEFSTAMRLHKHNHSAWRGLRALHILELGMGHSGWSLDPWRGHNQRPMGLQIKIKNY